MFSPISPDSCFTTKPRRRGIGRTTWFSITRRHDGFPEVASEPGKGSLFHVYLSPVGTPAEETPETPLS